MKKRIALILLFAMVLGCFTGCMGTPVVYSACTCPTEGTTPAPTEPAVTIPADGSSVKKLAPSSARTLAVPRTVR